MVSTSVFAAGPAEERKTREAVTEDEEDGKLVTEDGFVYEENG